MWISALHFMTEMGSSLVSTGAEVASSEVTEVVVDFVIWTWESVVDTIFP